MTALSAAARYAGAVGSAAAPGSTTTGNRVVNQPKVRASSGSKPAVSATNRPSRPCPSSSMCANVWSWPRSRRHLASATASPVSRTSLTPAWNLAGISPSSAAVASGSTETARLRSRATVSVPAGARLPSGPSGPGRGRWKAARSGANPAVSRSCVQRRNEVPTGGSSSGTPDVNCRQAVARSSMRIRQDTPSTTTWCTTTTSCRAARRQTARSITPWSGSIPSVASSTQASSGSSLSCHPGVAPSGSGMSKLQRSPRTSTARSMSCLPPQR